MTVTSEGRSRKAIVSKTSGRQAGANCSETTSTSLRLQAEQVRLDLENVVARFSALDPAHRDHVHVLFAELYLCETASWLEYLTQAPQPELAYRVIPRFHELYQEHVLDGLDRPLAAIAPHWRAYHRLSRRLTMRSPISSHLLLISLGARAHTRFDLGRAICESAGGMECEGNALFGSLSDRAFLHATRTYIERHLDRQRGWRWLVLRIFRTGLVLLRAVWLLEFQRWRRASFRGWRKTAGPASPFFEVGVRPKI